MVSVVMITYAHENYIREAIEGVLMQECDFEVELIIANDCSPDKTDLIIKDIIQNHPRGNWIKYHPHEKNLGMMPNFIFALQQAKGKYIALCDGDDYWIDALKLQKQVDFLDKNLDYSLVFHNALVHNTIRNEKRLFTKNYEFSEYDAFDIFKNWLIPTASMVFRNYNFINIPEFMQKATNGDLALQVYLNDFGKFYASNEVMSVYRLNPSSVTISSFSGIKHKMAQVNQLKLMNTFFKKKYNVEIKSRIFLYYLINANQYKRKSVLKQIFWIMRAIFINPQLMFYYNNQFKNSIKAVVYTSLYIIKLKK